MGEKFCDNGVWREIVTMKVEPHPGNESGTVRIYRDQVPEGAVILDDVDADAPATGAPWAPTPTGRKKKGG